MHIQYTSYVLPTGSSSSVYGLLYIEKHTHLQVEIHLLNNYMYETYEYKTQYRAIVPYSF